MSAASGVVSNAIRLLGSPLSPAAAHLIPVVALAFLTALMTFMAASAKELNMNFIHGRKDFRPCLEKSTTAPT
ncbi:hypothetical protein DFH09DRAFT_1166803 [Mycena vulgaris]|nr:hypothetical protein DFH09DRAFT_1166803 [Mycena vulgaris]